jgi:hypothetical protein
MKTAILFSTVIVLICGSAMAQTWMDSFTYAAGPLPASWTLYGGTFVATGSAAQAEFRSIYQYAIEPVRVLRDGVVQCDVIYNPKGNGNLQFGGVTLRCNDPTGGLYGADMVLMKVQGSGGFTAIWVIELTPTGQFYAKEINGIKPFGRATVRLIAVDSRLTVQVDTDGDHRWDHVIEKTGRIQAKAGPMGFLGYNGVLIDNFKQFDAVAYGNRGGAQPQPGKTVIVELRGYPGQAYQAATALATSGIGLGPASAIPLQFDGVFFTSLFGLAPVVFQDFTGRLDLGGDGRVSVAIPLLPALVGVSFFTAFVNFDSTGITAISNDLGFTIEP